MIGQYFLLPVRLPILGFHCKEMPTFNQYWYEVQYRYGTDTNTDTRHITCKYIWYRYQYGGLSSISIGMNHQPVLVWQYQWNTMYKPPKSFWWWWVGNKVNIVFSFGPRLGLKTEV